MKINMSIRKDSLEEIDKAVKRCGLVSRSWLLSEPARQVAKGLNGLSQKDLEKVVPGMLVDTMEIWVGRVLEIMVEQDFWGKVRGRVKKEIVVKG